MNFDFLPNLPKSNLDDRTFKDLVEECILRIPRYCPEWTNYNPSDPGITLIELFAWLTDQMLVRFNQVPQRNYVAFLELLGIRLQAPAPARVDLTFYLTDSLPWPYVIPGRTEVSTERRINLEAVVFTTDQPLVIGRPRIEHFLKADTTEEAPRNLQDGFGRYWSFEDDQWKCREQTPLFKDRPQPGNCFYLVFAPEEALASNVLSITFKGEAATSTGINPSLPPRRWEAWSGDTWEPILWQEADDQTRGFSFSELARRGYDPAEGAAIILHLPKQWPSSQFMTYQGHWIRCICTIPSDWQPGYIHSPRVTGMAARSIGGTVGASQCSLMENESLGTSNGKPGQAFQLQSYPVIARQADEYIQVTPSNEPPQVWQEVIDFSHSSAEDLHYVIDSLTGIVQFGPLIRESTQLRQQTQWRSREQFSDRNGNGDRGSRLAVSSDYTSLEGLERQYGKIPTRGSEIKIVAYRTGGGAQGNVQEGQLKMLRSAIPYIKSVVNLRAARGGTDAESLNEAVMRVPQVLRTRDRAVTPEDFEVLALEAGRGKIARVHCLSPNARRDSGRVRLLLVPQVEHQAIDQGLNPDESLRVDVELKQQIEAYLADRKLLGVQVLLEEPEYVGVGVQTEVALEPQYNTPRSQEKILTQLRTALYQFLNPLTGGVEGRGWPIGCPVHPSDILAICQKVTGVRYLGAIQLFEVRKQNQGWIRIPALESRIDPGATGLICSWHNPALGCGHILTLI